MLLVTDGPDGSAQRPRVEAFTVRTPRSHPGFLPGEEAGTVSKAEAGAGGATSTQTQTRPEAAAEAPRIPAPAKPPREPVVVRSAPDSIAAVLVCWDVSVPFPRTRTPGDAVQPSERRGTAPELWCVDRQRLIPRGASAFLLVQGSTCGLIGHGVVSRPPFLAARRDRPGTVAQHLLVEWTAVLAVPDRVPFELLASEVPECDWTRMDGSALGLGAAAAERLEVVWTRWIARTQPGDR
jgi:hypothetical protein